MAKGKAPADQFYWEDWLRDVELQSASACTKGVWINLLCRMWFAEIRGELVGSREILTKLSISTEEEFNTFFTEAQALGFCEVSRKPNSVITIRNRRMYKAEKEREKGRLRQQKYYKKQKKTEPNGDITPPSSSSSSSTPSKNPPNPPYENYKSFDKYDDKTKDAVVVLIKQVCETQPLTESKIFKWINRSLKQGLRIEAVSQGLESVTDNESIEKPIPYMSTVARRETDSLIEEERERLHEKKKARKPDDGLLDKLGVEGKKV